MRTLIAITTTLAVMLVPSVADAKTCKSGQFDRGGTCTSYAAAAKKVADITRSVIAAEGARAVILRVDVGTETLANRGFGESMEGVPASPKMHFRPGAMAIPMLMTVLLQLQDEGQLDLDEKLSKWYPDYPNAGRITLRMLASSTGGYPDYIQGNQPFLDAFHADVFRHFTDSELITYAFALKPFPCDPGACFHYAHTNFVILGRIAEKVTGRSVTNLITTRFFRKVGLRDTLISKLPEIPAPALHAYTRDRGVYEDSTTWSPSWGIGTGMVMTSTTSDMNKEIRAIGSGRMFSKAAMREFVTPYSSGLPGAIPAIDYALGVNVANGWMFQNPEFNGYTGILAYLPARDISIVVENTNGPKVAEGRHISGVIAKQLTLYLTPDRPLSRG
jgi:CubicO group peptidase (beta-lactamase class C family)